MQSRERRENGRWSPFRRNESFFHPFMHLVLLLYKKCFSLFFPVVYLSQNLIFCLLSLPVWLFLLLNQHICLRLRGSCYGYRSSAIRLIPKIILFLASQAAVHHFMKHCQTIVSASNMSPSSLSTTGLFAAPSASALSLFIILIINLSLGFNSTDSPHLTVLVSSTVYCGAAATLTPYLISRGAAINKTITKNTFLSS